MLSKVISGRSLISAPAAVFPTLSGPPPAPGAPAQFSRDGDAERRGFEEAITRLEAANAVARNDGFAAGREEGLAHARAEVQPIIERMNSSITEMTSLRSDLRRRAEKDVVRFALLIARRVLHRELAVDEGALTAVARVAFERLTRSESYQVTVHPRFAVAIRAALPASQAPKVQIQPDPDCAPGTLIVHSPEGIIDASVEAQLDEITRGLTDRIGI